MGACKVRDQWNSTVAEKIKVFRIGLESEGTAKDPLTAAHIPPSSSGRIGEKTIDSVGKVGAERSARLRCLGGQLQQAKRNQVRTLLVVLLDLPLSIGIAAFPGPVDQKS